MPAPDPTKALELPVDELALEVLADLVASNECNYLNSALQDAGYRGAGAALRALAYATLRNPSGHREVDYDDVAEAAEAVVVASLLMRVLDRVERRPREQA